jgi:hypothetical protein
VTAVASVSRLGDWALSGDPHGGPPIHSAECTTCHEESPAADDTGEPDVWCLRHAARTGHTGFRYLVTTFRRATRLTG